MAARSPWIWLACALLAGCASTPTSTRMPLVPPLDIDVPVAAPEPRVRADSDRSPPLPPPAPADELEQPGATDGADVHLRDRVIVQTIEVEVPVYRDRPQFDDGQDFVSYGYSPAPRYGYPTWRRRSTFPINTAIGAGVGAIIGHQRGRRDRGALIGGSVGLMFDLMRGWR